MSDLREYKCPACGGAMEFDSGSQKMKCPFCGEADSKVIDYRPACLLYTSPSPRD